MIAVPLDKGLTDVEIENSILRAKVDGIIYEEKYEEITKKIRKERKIKYIYLHMYGKTRRKRIH